MAFDAEGEVVWVVEEPNQIEEGNHYPVKNNLSDPIERDQFFSLAEYRLWQGMAICLGWIGWDHAPTVGGRGLESWDDTTRSRFCCCPSMREQRHQV